MKPTFKKISNNETHFEYKNTKFVLLEKSQGVYGMGKCVMLYKLDGFDKKYLKRVGFTSTDNHGGENDGDLLIQGITHPSAIQKRVIEYIDEFI